MKLRFRYVSTFISLTNTIGNNRRYPIEEIYLLRVVRGFIRFDGRVRFRDVVKQNEYRLEKTEKNKKYIYTY